MYCQAGMLTASVSIEHSLALVRYEFGKLCDTGRGGHHESIDGYREPACGYQMITEKQVQLDLSYLVEHLPPQLHIILATRADPPLPLSLLRARQQILEVRTDQLRCTVKETRAFFHKVMGIQFSDETIQEVT